MQRPDAKGKDVTFRNCILKRDAIVQKSVQWVHGPGRLRGVMVGVTVRDWRNQRFQLEIFWEKLTKLTFATIPVFVGYFFPSHLRPNITGSNFET